ncbi:ATP-binding protein [Streptomyces sp. NPDC004542]|uniref:ATP-binding protein n=1 Tax=Streptomyces sp. NPDC004542 TaxID=3154281 RepID=UPI00339F73BF
MSKDQDHRDPTRSIATHHRSLPTGLGPHEQTLMHGPLLSESRNPSPSSALNPYLLPTLDPLSGLPHPPPIPFAAPWHYELRFPCDPRGPGIARVTLRAVLDAHGLAELADRAELLACELTTNSVRHTKGPASVRLQWLYPVLRVSVWDMSPDLPPTLPGFADRAVTGPEADAEGGRGLLILDAVADRWGGCAIGGEPHGPGGKSLWFELTLPGPPPDDRPASALVA